MRSKLEAAALAGFTAIDLFDTDWEKFKRDYAVENHLPQSTVDGDQTSIAAAIAINSLCSVYNIKLLCLQPFREFEARLDPNETAQRIRAARGTISILPFLGCDMLLIPSTTLPAQQLIPDIARVATELGELADYALSLNVNGSPVKICYEALSWGTFINTWEQAWEAVKLANRPNLGVCLDSFNTAAREWADPYHPSGVQQPSDLTASSFSISLMKLSQLSPDKIFYFQVADGRRMLPPLVPSTDPTIPPLRPWSRSSRLFPLEVSRGAYLPVVEFTKAVIRTGYDGPWALEIFNDSLNDPRSQVPLEHATRGMESLEKLFVACTFNNGFQIAMRPALILPSDTLSTASGSSAQNIEESTTVSKLRLKCESYATVQLSASVP